MEVRIKNAGGEPVAGLLVVGELAARRSESRLERLAPGEGRPLSLSFPPELPRPGRHALTLLIDYQPEQPAGAPRQSERACVLLPFGVDPPPAVAVRAPAIGLDLTATLDLTVESRDGAAHEVELRLIPPYGINVLEARERLTVPPRGLVVVPVRLIRGAAARGQSHRLLTLVRPLDGPLERADLTSSQVDVAADPARLPRLRPGLIGAGLLLLLAAVALEILRWRRA